MRILNGKVFLQLDLHALRFCSCSPFLSHDIEEEPALSRRAIRIPGAASH
jgi:hypothetical protein